MAGAAIETLGLIKRFGRQPVLDGLTFRVEPGEVFCLLGPNGAGKSTLLHLILGFLRPDAGEIRVLGAAPGPARHVGYLPERVRYHAHFAPREYLRYLGRFASLDGRTLEARVAGVLAQVDLTAASERRLGTFSKGMLQRLGLAQALLGDPELLLVDEPTSGLDPAGQREVLDILLDLRRRGHTILACTHQLAEVELLADRVGVLWQNRLAALVRLADLPTAGGVVVQVRGAGPSPDVAARLAALGPAVAIAGREVRVHGDESIQQAALRGLVDAGLAVADLRPIQSGIEALYLEAIRGGSAEERVEAAKPREVAR